MPVGCDTHANTKRECLAGFQQQWLSATANMDHVLLQRQRDPLLFVGLRSNNRRLQFTLAQMNSAPVRENRQTGPLD